MRLTSGVLVAAAATFTLGVGLAGSASAASANSVTVTPTSQTSASGVCATYTATILDSNGNPVSPHVTPTLDITPAAGSPADANSAICSLPTSTNNSGQSTFSIKAAAALNETNTYNIRVSTSGGTVSGGATLIVSNTINDTVNTLSVSPTAANAYASEGVWFVAHATDVNGNPVVGATVSNTANGSVNTTDAAGNATVIVNSGLANSSVTFYVNRNDTGNTNGVDPGEKSASATITIVAKQAATDLTLSCPDQLVAGTGGGDCTVPAGTTPITFTAKLVNGTTPVSGAVVQFEIWSGSGSLSALYATTDSNGVATTTLTPSSTSNNSTVTVHASAETNSGTLDRYATETEKTRHASTITLNPGDESVTTGGVVTEQATVKDQFGTPVAGDTVFYNVNGRNTIVVATATTNASGVATISYTDTGTSGTIDHLGLSDGSASASATISYVTGSVAPASVTLNFVTGPANPNATCVASTTDPQDTMGDTEEVCAQVKNSAGELLGGVPVAFSVDKGTVDGSNPYATGATNSTTVTTHGSTSANNGVAIAFVGSELVGAQHITATAGGVTSNTLTDTYKEDVPAPGPFAVTLTPASATLNPGNTQKFTATVTDKFGNPLSSKLVVFGQTGPGTLDNTIVATSADGTASVSLSTTSTDTGSGSVSATLSGTCSTQCTATATYSVVVPSVEKPVLTLSSAFKHHLHAVIQTNPAESGVAVHLYTLNPDGSIKAYVAKANTNKAGLAHYTFQGTASGKVYTMVAKVFGHTPYTEEVSNSKSLRSK